jgi:hypothetical protein
MKEIYRVIFWNDAGEIRVTAPTFYDDAYKTAEAWKGTIYREEKTQPIKEVK